MAGTVKGVVVFDGYSYLEDDVPKSGVKGQVLEISQAELDRGLSLGALAKPNSAEAKTAIAAVEAARRPTVDQSAPGIAGDLILADPRVDALESGHAAVEARVVAVETQLEETKQENERLRAELEAAKKAQGGS